MTHPHDEAARGGGVYVGRAAAREAVALVAPMMEGALGRRDVVGSGFLYVVVMDPACEAGAASFDEAVLYEQGFGDRTQWDADYAAFARAKARLSWLTGRDGRTVQALLPHLLRDGDTALSGGVCLDGIVVGVSGAFPEFDELFAGAVALALRALARQARQADKATTLRASAERTR